MQNARIVGYISHPPKSRGITFGYCPSAADLPKVIMKYFVAIFLLALAAIAMAVETSEGGNIKESQDADVARDKRGFAHYSPYSYTAPYAYNTHNLPYAYSPYAYPYYNYRHYNYPYYNHHPYYY
ncbi:hypothetical protein ALC62_07083 [Cyphomyrmex costatus]|uniref:Uncharacterized protein n=1 Tax=Cyphomyrmex costatus TaxID=456900 RepID=A0A195CN07_9HYME|nr:hypothetical protein ALC62_07083 [Cyphomyrmex costatus]